jgi:hypothetical protein
MPDAIPTATEPLQSQSAICDARLAEALAGIDFDLRNVEALFTRVFGEPTRNARAQESAPSRAPNAPPNPQTTKGSVGALPCVVLLNQTRPDAGCSTKEYIRERSILFKRFLQRR